MSKESYESYSSDFVASITKNTLNGAFLKPNDILGKTTGYIRRKKWDDIYEEQYLKSNIEIDNDIESDNLNVTTEETQLERIDDNIYDNCPHSEIFVDDRCPNKYSTFRIIGGNYHIEDLKMHISIENFNDDLIYDAMFCLISVEIGQDIIYNMSMASNLIFCKIFKKKIKETSDSIVIPIIFFELIGKMKFPMQRIQRQEILIRITHRRCIDPDRISITSTNLFGYHQKGDMFNNVRYPMFEIQTNTHIILLSEPIRFNFHNIVQFLIIRFEHNTIDSSCLNKIGLSLCGCEPMYWTAENNEIIHTNSFGHDIYMISLIPMVRTIKDIRHVICDSNIHGCGINFFEMGQSVISFEFDFPDENYHTVSIIGVSTNILEFGYGMVGRCIWSDL
jgi:hypothetical protein